MDKIEQENAAQKFLDCIKRLFKKKSSIKGKKIPIGYSDAFENNVEFTEFISSVIDKVADEMDLIHHREYYTLDHVLYKDEDIG